MTQISTNSKVAFIKTPIPKLQDDKLEPDMGLLYIATYLKRRFVTAQPIYIDLSVDNINDITDIIKTCKYFCFSTYTANYYLTLELVAEIKKVAPKDATYIAGGHHASALPEEVAKDFDYVIVGEGEKALYSLFSDFACGKHPESRIIIGECIKSLDEIGWIDYSMVKMDQYTRTVKGQKSVSILTSRGCPYHCNFCNSYLMKRYKSIRFRTAKDVFGEIIFLNKTYGITNFRIQDDIFSINLKRLKELSELLAPYSFSFRCFARIDNVNKEVLTCFKKMGVFHLSFGVESGSQKILDLMNKGITVEQIKQSILLAKEYGMKCRVYLIAGYPGETEETIDETINLMKEVCPDDISIYPLIPYPGTRLFHHPEEFRITYIDKDFSKYYQIFGNKDSGYVFETEDMDLSTLKHYRNKLVDGLADVCPWAIDDEQNR